MLGTNVGFVWPPHIKQCPTMPNNVGICWDKCWHLLARALKCIKTSGVPSGYARYSVNTQGYQKNIFLKKRIPVKPKIQYSHILLYEISTLDCHY